MDSDRFDALTRLLSVGRSRRGLAPLLGGLTLGGVLAPLLGLADADAKKKKNKKKKKNPSSTSPPPLPPPPPPPPPPTCSDGGRNGRESDIDCGGGACPRCANGKVCVNRVDCTSAYCLGGTCQGCTSDAACGSDANGVCRCFQAGGPCYSMGGIGVANCSQCSPSTTCLHFGMGIFSCYSLCGSS